MGTPGAESELLPPLGRKSSEFRLNTAELLQGPCARLEPKGSLHFSGRLLFP